MATIEDINRQEALLKQQLETTKNISDRRKLRAELRGLKEKKEKLTDENGNETKTPSMSSKFTMSLGSSERNRYQERTNRINREESPARKENVAPQKPKNTRSTYSFKMASTEEKAPETRATEIYPRRHQTNHVQSNIEEKKPRKDQDMNNNKMEKEKQEEVPKRMSRRSSLAELFKIDQAGKEKERPSTAPPVHKLTVSSSPTVQQQKPLEMHQDMKTKQDLLQNLGRLRGRRRSVREIERKEELDGLMYVKSGDTVKLVNTSKGDEQAKEQRKIRRTSRKESHEKIKIEGDTVSACGETELTPIQESPRSPNAPSKFGFTKESDEPQKTMNVPPTREEPPKTRIWQPPPRLEPPKPGPAARQWSDPGPPRRPNSFLPPKNDGPKFGQGAGGMGSVKDRMAFFRKAEEEEQKAKAKQFVHRAPSAPTPVNRFKATTPPSQTGSTAVISPTSQTTPTSPTEKVSLKKAPDPNKTPRDLKKKPQLKRQMSVSSLILTWCKDVTQDYEGVNITNFSGSFSTGLAFCALIHKFNPDKFDYNSLSAENREHNFKLAFETGISVGIPALLDVEDMVRLKKPEPRSVQCYVQMIFSKYRPKDLDMSNLIIA